MFTINIRIAVEIGAAMYTLNGAFPWNKNVIQSNSVRPTAIPPIRSHPTVASLDWSFIVLACRACSNFNEMGKKIWKFVFDYLGCP